jgi:hypothetical protein
MALSVRLTYANGDFYSHKFVTILCDTACRMTTQNGGKPLDRICSLSRIEEIAMKILSYLVLVAASSHLAAQSLSDQDIHLLTASSAAMSAYKAGGMTSVYNQVNRCYAKLPKRPPQPAKNVEYCIALDMSGVFIDYHVSLAAGFPRNDQFMDDVASNRMHGALLKTGISSSVADTRHYLESRNARVAKYVSAAIALADEPTPPHNSNNSCIQKEMSRWKKQHDLELNKYCTDLAKKGEECRVSAGQEALMEEEAKERALKKCR